MTQEPGLSVRKPVGAVLSIRVPRELAVAVDEFASDRSMTLSEVVRLAIEGFLASPPLRIRWTLYGSTDEAARLVLNSTAASMSEANRGRAQTQTIERPLELIPQ